jgi:hypothetical protein
MRVATVVFTAGQQPITAYLIEVYGVTGYNNGAGNTTASGAAAPRILSSGAFIPTNNNANGGTLIFSFFTNDAPSGGAIVSRWDKSNGSTLLEADSADVTSQGLFKAAQVFLQTTAASITPQIQANHTGTLDAYVGLGFALNLGSQGTAPNAFRIVRMLASANSNSIISPLQLPMAGNCGGLFSFGTLSTGVDNEGTSWTVNTGAGDNPVVTTQNRSANDVRTLTLTGTNTSSGWYWFDIIGADTTAWHDFTATGATGITNGATSVSGIPNITPTVAGMTINYTTNGLGPTPGVTAPTGADYLFPTFSTLTDGGRLALGNGLGVYYHGSSLAAQSWTWNLANANVSSGTYNSGTGTVTIVLASFFGAFTGVDIFITLTGTGSVATISGHFVVATDGGDGLHFTYTGTTGLTLTITGGNVTQYNDLVNGTAMTVKTSVTSDSGTLTATDPTDTAAFVALLGVTGTLSQTDPTDTGIFTGGIVGTGTLSATDSADTAAFAGNVTWNATLAATDPTDTAIFNGLTAVLGTLNTTDQTDTANFTGQGVSPTGTLAATEPTDTIDFEAQLVSSGVLNATEVADPASMAGTVTAGPDSGTFATTENIDTGLITGSVISQGTMNTMENADGAAFSGYAGDATGTLNATEPTDTAAFGNAQVTPVVFPTPIPVGQRPISIVNRLTDQAFGYTSSNDLAGGGIFSFNTWPPSIYEVRNFSGSSFSILLGVVSYRVGDGSIWTFDTSLETSGYQVTQGSEILP